MTRTPLRPLARIIEARQKGENPDAIERENLRLRHEAQRDRMRVRAESRLLLVALCFLLAFGAVGMRMGALATTEAEEPTVLELAVEAGQFSTLIAAIDAAFGIKVLDIVLCTF